MIPTKVHPLVKGAPCADKPREDTPVHPWRYMIGDHVYVRDLKGEREFDEIYYVEGGELFMGCPHYVLSNKYGEYYRVPQIHLMRKLPHKFLSHIS